MIRPDGGSDEGFGFVVEGFGLAAGEDGFTEEGERLVKGSTSS